MFEKILIANRGEIACRVIRTAKRLGIATVAVYSDADATARHVALADEAYRIGPAPARESYLRAELVLEVARRSGAQAVHPGYGFLSENADFAEACAQAGITFIGPPVAAIAAMGSKSAAKKIMEQAGVPLVPGYHGDDQDPAFLSRQAEKIGFPLLIKASAGGGGKGMRVVRSLEEFPAALAGAKREAANAFGDERVLLERYLTKPRHVEIQVFGDTQGNLVHLFERDCSIQRRHQKVLEEAPAPGMNPGLREKMGQAAVAAARAIGYTGAGTVEFLLDEDGSFYFMEMNTRLQVEHPVTEMITGVDLVEWQLRVAAGQALPCRQQDLEISGHAIEARLYAEDPAKEFLPSIGLLRHLRSPEDSVHVRIDTGVRRGDEVSMHYDPMIAKLIVWDTDRAGALRRLRQALAEYQVVGVTTNLAFLGAVAAHPAFIAGDLDTGFIERHRAALFPESRPAVDQVLALGCLDVLLRRAGEARAAARASADPYSPWHSANGWRLNGDNHHDLTFVDGEASVSVIAHYRPHGYLLDLPGGTLPVRGEITAAGDLLADLDGKRVRATVVRHGQELTILEQGAAHRLVLVDPYAHAGEQEEQGGTLTAPMPGKVIAVMVESGAQVKKGAPLMILEAMKMEHTISAPADGRITDLLFSVGALVSEGAQLLAFETEEA
ncbi:acetyl/propionyl/methylcrotonyl-CoA carboxylase subunit alpha [Geoalkalibacter halelectricus]|uniref:Acetyl/propionyl/methylcrotonyl-CoA carboxylase subunit alpha n=1 Tax=Geoalkalibacter halelectricus TaxID=2847045 RepID=A0ABY5ZM53_9BACT|nr:acetyl/propionyl/methylcrotonyl-CoA carboxylase subunit alpha [Geoalkalibacter halelectricus]MDO3380277.1 acetyl/propionyl/methylcrotonyl-CoA carboxylase subunit alpha [Geoalkalibacter halelectricus]UWZ79544.1 acetyl/propionyl/methylcrotonyl-CoA carboxylase subunit alpha [Geoalkalibacter halelectricus]